MMFLKKTFLISLVPVLLAGLLVVSCDQPINGGDPVNAKAPSVTAQPQGGNWDVSEEDAFTLTVTASSPDGGTLSYQWYENTTNATTGGTAIENSDDATLTVEKDDYLYNQDYYFYVVITNTIADNGDGGEKTATAISSAAKVTVSGNLVNARPPDITVQPTGGTWDVSEEDAFTLTVTAASPDEGTLSYQWYRGASAAVAPGDTTIGEDEATLILKKEHYSSDGDLYIYVVVTSTIAENDNVGTKSATVTSSVATVTVSGNGVAMVNAQVPSITAQPTGGTWDVSDDDEFTLTVTANVTDGGTLSYQWYKNTTNSTTGGEKIDEADEATLTLAKADYAGGVYYFYVVVTNTIDENNDGGMKTATATSNAVTVTIPINAQQPSITAQPTGGSWNVSSVNNFSLTVTANVTDGGTLSYQWYKNTANTTTGGTAIGTNNATLTLAKADYEFNLSYYFYVVVTNTITENHDGGVKTAAVTSNAATVTVTGGSTAILIDTADDMAKIGTAGTHPLSEKYLLMNDITLTNWTPIGNSTSPFTGRFDGNGHKIILPGNAFDASAVSSSTDLGIFGYARDSSIKNLTVQSSANAVSTSTQDQNIGLLAGRTDGTVIENITLTGTFGFKSNRTIQIGGAVGHITGTGSVVKNINSSLDMNIIPGSSAAASSYTYAGGIVGTFRNGAGIENCHNAGNVTADNVLSEITTNGQVFVGGITGGSSYGFSTAYDGYISDCSFTGTLIGKAKGNWTFAGGIAAVICGGTTANINQTTRIERCWVTGTVSTAGTASGFPYVGGIVGYIYYGALVSQCYFAGEVIANKSGDYTGGIAGYNSRTTAPNTSRIEDCWSSGTVTGYGNAGGIVGQNEAGAAVKNSYSTTVVSASSAGTGVGGIAGLLGATDSASSVSACVALNPLVTANAGNNINRVTGTFAGSLSNNHAWTGMVITTGGVYTERKGATAADGADIAAQTPPQNFYTGLGWNFSTVWKMGAAGFPLLRWQDETPVSGGNGTVNTINVSVTDPALDNRTTLTITQTVNGSLKKGTGSTINFLGSITGNTTYLWYMGTELKKSGGTIANSRQWYNVSVDDFETGANTVTAVITVNGAPYSANTVVVVTE